MKGTRAAVRTLVPLDQEDHLPGEILYHSIEEAGQDTVRGLGPELLGNWIRALKAASHVGVGIIEWTWGLVLLLMKQSVDKYRRASVYVPGSIFESVGFCQISTVGKSRINC